MRLVRHRRPLERIPPRQLLGQAYEDAFQQEFPELAGEWIADKLIEQRRTASDQLWRRFGGRDGHPLTRTGYEELAMTTTPCCRSGSLRSFPQAICRQGIRRNNEFAHLRCAPVDESFHRPQVAGRRRLPQLTNERNHIMKAKINLRDYLEYNAGLEKTRPH